MTRTTSAQAKKTATTRKTTAKKSAAAAPRAARKATPAKKTAAPRLSLVKAPTDLPTRTRPWMTDIQGHATLAARLAGIHTPHIQDWRDHRNGTASRPLQDGTLHYHHDTRTLTWQAVCLMGAVHTYRLDSPSAATWARINANNCPQPHADLSTVPALTTDELTALGLLQQPTIARQIPGEPAITETKTVTLPTPAPRALGDQLTHTPASAADTQPLPALDNTADNDTAREHPQP